MNDKLRELAETLKLRNNGGYYSDPYESYNAGIEALVDAIENSPELSVTKHVIDWEHPETDPVLRRLPGTDRVMLDEHTPPSAETAIAWIEEHVLDREPMADWQKALLGVDGVHELQWRRGAVKPPASGAGRAGGWYEHDELAPQAAREYAEIIRRLDESTSGTIQERIREAHPAFFGQSSTASMPGDPALLSDVQAVFPPSRHARPFNGVRPSYADEPVTPTEHYGEDSPS